VEIYSAGVAQAGLAQAGNKIDPRGYHPQRRDLSSRAAGMTDRDRAAAAQPWTDFESEVLPHADRLFRLAMWWERDRTEAEDLVQETLVQALQSFHRFRPGTNCRAWLLSILHHVRSNRRRSKLRRLAREELAEHLAETAQFVPPVPQQLTDEDILAALDGIPQAFQDIILLCDVEELTYKEIAAALGLPMGTVMSRLHRGRALLRQQLASMRAAGDAGAGAHAASRGIG
jgi:RNA polymerase sigma-70 factor (ECF subfamily)